MLRRNLTICVLMMIAMVAIATTVQAGVGFGVGINSTTKSPQSWIGTRMDLNRFDIMGMWAANMGVTPKAYSSSSLRIDTACDLIGYNHLREVVFIVTNAKGKEYPFPAQKVRDKQVTYSACVNLGKLPPGSYSLSWRVKSKDEVKSLDALLFEINTLRNRQTAAGVYLMLTKAPVNEEMMSDDDAWLYISGFDSASAEPDPAKIAKRQMLVQMTSQPAQSAPQQVAQPAEPEARAAEGTDEGKMVIAPAPTPEPVNQTTLRFNGWDCPIIGSLEKDVLYRFLEPDGSESGRFKVKNIGSDLITTILVRSGNPSGAASIFPVEASK